jgi:hypothetical protein
VSGQEPVRIPKEVLEQLESVRRYARAEVLDIPTVRHVAMERGKPALVVWIDKHEQEYGLGLLDGFVAEDQAAIDRTARPKGRYQGHGPRSLSAGRGARGCPDHLRVRG